MTTDTTYDRPTDLSVELEHVTIENEDAPDECAIFPTDSSRLDPGTNWIVAHDDAFVSRDEIR